MCCQAHQKENTTRFKRPGRVEVIVWPLIPLCIGQIQAQFGLARARNFYRCYYVGYKGKFSHEFSEFKFRTHGRLRYANNSNYKNDGMIRKEAYVHKRVTEELKGIINDREVTKEDDALWPLPDGVGW
uniref:Uncharacterized protein n=1 Tax=Vombatus ursinus TaxID=29139 RepID=A0A4X2M3D5_VOMUR